MNDQDPDRLMETARILGIRADELDYLGEDLSAGIEIISDTDIPFGNEDVSEIEIAAAKSRSLIVPNRISYGVYLQQSGFSGGRVQYKWMGLTDTCTHTSWSYLWDDSISRWERAGWCRRPQTDAYDIRWKIYWRA